MTSLARRRRGPRTGAPSIKELSFGVSSAENERDAVARFEPFAGYLTRKLGVPVHVLWSSDYAAVIQALKSNRIQFARIGAANYALGRKVMGDRIEPVGTDQAEDGSTGYYSVVVVRADSPYHSLADLRGKILAWADPNSGSGYAVPLYYMKKQGIDPATFFSNTPFSGSHSETSSNVTRMEEKGMIAKGLTRDVWKSPARIPNPPYVMRSDLPSGLRTAFRAVLAGRGGTESLSQPGKGRR